MTLAPRLLFTAAALASVGCYAAAPGKEKVILIGDFGDADAPTTKLDKPAISFKDECQRAATYGDLYGNTCSFYVNQCNSQSMFRERDFQLSFFDQLTGMEHQYNAGKTMQQCVDSSNYLAMRHGPTPRRLLVPTFHWPVGTHLLLQAQSYVSPLLDPKNSSKEKAELAERLLTEHALLDQGTSIDQLISGRIVDAMASETGREELVIMMLDAPEVDDVQDQIFASVCKLYPKGLSLVGSARDFDKRAVECDIYLGDAASQLSCENEENLAVIGVADRKAWEKQAQLASMNSQDGCKSSEMMAANRSFITYRSDMIFSGLLDLMEERDTNTASLVVEADHLRGLRAMFEAEGISYITIAVPAFDQSFVHDYLEHNQQKLDGLKSNAELFNATCE